MYIKLKVKLKKMPFTSSYTHEINPPQKNITSLPKPQKQLYKTFLDYFLCRMKNFM